MPLRHCYLKSLISCSHSYEIFYNQTQTGDSQKQKKSATIIAKAIMSPLTRFFLAFLTNALLGASTVQGQDAATPLVFDGTLLSSDGGPVPGAQIQFWQTDRFGRYNHPGDLQDGAALDPAFQYFGTETTGEDGRFAFRTIRPGKYAYRPPHIHFKVWQTTADGTRENTLTSQWYFADDATAAGQPDALKLEVEEEEVGPGGGAVTLRTGKTITVATGGPSGTGTGAEPPTPAQQEGPFYPVVDFFGLDGDLTAVSTDLTDPPAAASPAVPPAPSAASAASIAAAASLSAASAMCLVLA